MFLSLSKKEMDAFSIPLPLACAVPTFLYVLLLVYRWGLGEFEAPNSFCTLPQCLCVTLRNFKSFSGV